jgi:hypothetical protein
MLIPPDHCGPWWTLPELRIFALVFLLLALLLVACAEPPEPALWSVQETHEKFDGLELRLVRGRKSVEAWKSFRAFTEYRAARRERQARALVLARRAP